MAGNYTKIGGEKIILIEEYDDGEKFIVEINASGKAILHIDSDGFGHTFQHLI